MPSLNLIEIFGYNYQPNFLSFKLNDQPINNRKTKFIYNKIKKILIINKKNLINFAKNGPVWILSWNNY